jgi:hypothetical protein
MNFPPLDDDDSDKDELKTIGTSRFNSPTKGITNPSSNQQSTKKQNSINKSASVMLSKKKLAYC